MLRLGHIINIAETDMENGNDFYRFLVYSYVPGHTTTIMKMELSGIVSVAFCNFGTLNQWKYRYHFPCPFSVMLSL